MTTIPRTFVSALAGVAGSALGANPTFIALPLLPGARSAGVYGLSLDGREVAGTYTTGFQQRAFRYSLDSGMQEPLAANPLFPEASSAAFSMSSDGSFLTGVAVGPAGQVGASRIRPDQTPDYIGHMPGDLRSSVRSISGDGRVLVGQSVGDPMDLSTEPFRWTPEGGIQSLGSLFGFRHGNAVDVSRDGTTIVGASANAALYDKPFIWTQARGMVALPTLTGEFAESSAANAVSADGSIAFGYSSIDEPVAGKFVRWIGGVAEELPRLAGTQGIVPLDTSDTGSVTVGTLISPADGIRSFVWTEATGMMFPEDYLAMHGVNVPSGTLVGFIRSISGDGLTFGGSLRDGRAFVAVIPAVPSAAVVGVGLWAAGLRRRRFM